MDTLPPNTALIQQPSRCSASAIAMETWLTTVLLLAPAVLLAQPVPKLSSISPEWIQRGTTQEIVVTGENLSGVAQILFNGDAGLSGTNTPPVTPPKPIITIESTGGGITRAESGATKNEKRLVMKVAATAEAALRRRG